LKVAELFWNWPKGEPRDSHANERSRRGLHPALHLAGEAVAGWIEDGTYPSGSLLPSSACLAAAHSVSRATALHALEVLTKSGHARHVESKPHQVI